MTSSMASSISAFPRRCFSITRERYCANMTLPPSNKKRRGRETCPAPLPRLGYKKGRERRSLVGPASTAVKCALFIGSRALWSPAAGYLARHHQFWLSLFRIMTTASRKRIGEKIPRSRPVCQQGNFNSRFGAPFRGRTVWPLRTGKCRRRTWTSSTRRCAWRPSPSRRFPRPSRCPLPVPAP